MKSFERHPVELVAERELGRHAQVGELAVAVEVASRLPGARKV
jgi:hypothetical protein